MKMNKEHIDDLIAESLSKDEAEFYHTLEEEGLLKQWGGLYKGKMKGWAIYISIVQVIFTVITFYLGYKFFTVEAIREIILYGGGFFIAFITVSMLKLWHWMQMDKNSIIREIKRLEFQVAILTEKLSEK